MGNRLVSFRLNRNRMPLLVALLCATAFHAATAAETPTERPPAGEAAAAEPEAREAPGQLPELERYGQGRMDFSGQTPAGQRTTVPTSGATWRLILLLLVGGGLFWGVLVALRKHLPGGRQLFACPGMEVLGRTHLDPRRYLALVRVGTRVLVVGVSPDGLNCLSEIGEEAEVARLLETVRPRSEQGRSLFQRMFQTHLAKADEEEAVAEAEASAEDVTASLHALRDRVRHLRENE